MGWFWASEGEKGGFNGSEEAIKGTYESKCPVKPSGVSTGISGCPVMPKKGQTADSSISTTVEVLDPMNHIPSNLSSEKAPGQKITLLTNRTISTIPKGEDENEGLWEYPSPQQMYNAMLRKGKAQDIPEDAVGLMVEVHNFLNEGAWQQILEWELKYVANSHTEPRLLKFIGRPHDLSPRAYIFNKLSSVFPGTFLDQLPFDRHDWTVLRFEPASKNWKQVRYVIDYYSAPDDEDTGMPAFMLDTRPALDSVESCVDRFGHWAGPLWEKAMGRAVSDI